MLRILNQVRKAASLLNPDEVNRRANRLVTVGLASPDGAGYAAMEDLLLSTGLTSEERAMLTGRIYRAGDRLAPERCDLSLAYLGTAPSRGGYVYYPDAPGRTLDEIAADDDLALPLARSFPVFRKPLTDRMVRAVAKENALFALGTALPNVVPNLIELPWAVGEFASDTAFLTMNQVRMAFLVAAANGRHVSYSEQRTEVISILAGAFGWRAIARELAGKVPMGGGLIPKAAIAWAATWVVGKGLQKFNETNVMPGRDERKRLYEAAYEEGKQVASGLRRQLGSGKDGK